MYRVTNLFAALAILGIAVVGGLVALFVTWTLSDVAYDLGIWPIGALLRIAFWAEALGVFFGILAMLFNVVASPFRAKDWD